MDKLCGILLLFIVRTVSAGVSLQPTYPFEVDVTKYKLLEEFYPENDRDAIPVLQFLEKHRTPNAVQEEPTAIRRFFSQPEEISLRPRKKTQPYHLSEGKKPHLPHMKISPYVQQNEPKRPLFQPKATDEDDIRRISDVLAATLIELVQKVVRVAVKESVTGDPADCKV